MELNTEGRFLSDLTYGRLDENTLNAFTPVPAGFVADGWMNGPNINPAVWGRPIGAGLRRLRNENQPSYRIFEAYGSVRNQDNFFILEAYLNFLKNRVRLPGNTSYCSRLTTSDLDVAPVEPWPPG